MNVLSRRASIFKALASSPSPYAILRRQLMQVILSECKGVDDRTALIAAGDFNFRLDGKRLWSAVSSAADRVEPKLFQCDFVKQNAVGQRLLEWDFEAGHSFPRSSWAEVEYSPFCINTEAIIQEETRTRTHHKHTTCCALGSHLQIAAASNHISSDILFEHRRRLRRQAMSFVA
jgi:hypothetical protein